ncbi:hypothetical protein FLCH110379_00925 [Flavobacterium chungbukense]
MLLTMSTVIIWEKEQNYSQVNELGNSIKRNKRKIL